MSKSIQRHFLTIRQCVEGSYWTEAAVAGQGVSANLHFVLGSPTEVCQHSLVSLTLCVVALILTTPILPKRKELVEMKLTENEKDHSEKAQS